MLLVRTIKFLETIYNFSAENCTLKILLERKSFNAPIAKTQMIQQKIADMEVKIESARMLNYKAACLKDNKQVLTRATRRGLNLKSSVLNSKVPSNHKIL